MSALTTIADRVRERALQHARALALRLRTQRIEVPDMPNVTDTPRGTRTGSTLGPIVTPVVVPPSVK